MICFAVYFFPFSSATLILQSGFDINGVGARLKWNHYAGTVLKFATDKGAVVDIVEFLLANGANPDIPGEAQSPSMMLLHG
jgi:hypothetical protein